jgi:prevent-host-death family protein
MAHWQTADGRQRFTDLVEAANTDGPQVVMRHKEPVAVVLSPEEYRCLVRQADTNFADLPGQSPFAREDIQARAITPNLSVTIENLLAAYVDDEEAKAANREK